MSEENPASTPDRLAEAAARLGTPAPDSSWRAAAVRLQERLADAHMLIADMLTTPEPPEGSRDEWLRRAGALGVTAADGELLSSSQEAGASE